MVPVALAAGDAVNETPVVPANEKGFDAAVVFIEGSAGAVTVGAGGAAVLVVVAGC